MEILVIVQLCLLFFEQEQNKYTNVGTVGTLKKKTDYGDPSFLHGSGFH
jgi:hypothetical protein